MKDLLFYFRKGITPIEGEQEKDYLERAQKMWSKKCVCPYVLQQMEVSVDWVHIAYKWLLPWHLGYTELSSSYCVIVLSKLYTKRAKSALVHELVHVVRLPFCDSIYEETMAHLFSSAKWRGMLAYCFSSRKSLWFLLAFMSLYLIALSLFFLEISSFLWVLLFGLTLVGQILVEGLQSIRIWKIVNQARKNVKSLGLPPSTADGLFLRLSAQEINELSQGEQPDTCLKNISGLRGKLIRLWLADYEYCRL